MSVLKEVIQRAMKVPAEKQVLLISGGEALDPKLRVCQYSAGTDTNPIFLFSKSTIEGQTPPSPSIDYSSDTDLKVSQFHFNPYSTGQFWIDGVRLMSVEGKPSSNQRTVLCRSKWKER